MRSFRRGGLFVLLLVGVLGLGRFSLRVRTVDTVGLFASGMLAGLALSRLLRRD